MWEVKTYLTKYLHILKKFPLYKRIFQKYLTIFKTVRIIGKRKPPGVGKGKRRYYDWEEIWKTGQYIKQ